LEPDIISFPSKWN